MKIESNENYNVIKTNLFHDRFVFVDESGYFFGASFEDLGEKFSFGIRLMDFTKEDLIEKLKTEG